MVQKKLSTPHVYSPSTPASMVGRQHKGMLPLLGWSNANIGYQLPDYLPTNEDDAAGWEQKDIWKQLKGNYATDTFIW